MTTYEWDYTEFQYPDLVLNEKEENYDYLQYIDPRLEEEVDSCFNMVMGFLKCTRPETLKTRTLIIFYAFTLDGFYKEDLLLLRKWAQSILDLDKMTKSKDCEDWLANKHEVSENDMLLFNRLCEVCIAMVKKFTPAKNIDPNKKKVSKK